MEFWGTMLMVPNHSLVVVWRSPALAPASLVWPSDAEGCCPAMSVSFGRGLQWRSERDHKTEVFFDLDSRWKRCTCTHNAQYTIMLYLQPYTPLITSPLRRTVTPSLIIDNACIFEIASEHVRKRGVVMCNIIHCVFFFLDSFDCVLCKNSQFAIKRISYSKPDLRYLT